jgi:hypothetical protein
MPIFNVLSSLFNTGDVKSLLVVSSALSSDVRIQTNGALSALQGVAKFGSAMGKLAKFGSSVSKFARGASKVARYGSKAAKFGRGVSLRSVCEPGDEGRPQHDALWPQCFSLWTQC